MSSRDQLIVEVSQFYEAPLLAIPHSLLGRSADVDRPPYVAQTAREVVESLEDFDLNTLTGLYKRRKYHNYKDQREELDEIFKILKRDKVPRCLFSNIARVTGIPKSTLSTWRKRLRTHSDWRPSRMNYGRHRKVFTEDEEKLLIQHIRENFLERNLFYSDRDFHDDAIRFYNDLMRQRIQKIENGELPPQKIKNFKCSPHFVIDFRKRWAHSLRRPSLKRRPQATPEQISTFKTRVQNAIRKYGAERVINMDETNFRVVNNGFLTWALKGGESVTCFVGNDAKEGVTVIATISASGEKWPMMLIGKGKTKRCLRNYQLTDEIWTSLSESGWTRENVMYDYLDKVRRKISGPCCLILDTYTAHRTAGVRKKAEDLEIELLFVPPGCTDAAQPLDVKVFGVFKSYARMLWREYYHANPSAKVTKAVLAQHVTKAWQMVGERVVQSAWSVLEMEDFFDQSESDHESLSDGEFQLYCARDNELDL